MIIFLNGKFIEEKEAKIAVTDRGFTLGDGVFDTMLAVNGSLIDPDLHFQRLQDHATALKIPVQMDSKALKSTAEKLLETNAGNRLAIRTTISRGPGDRGLTPPEHPQSTILMRANTAPDPATLPPSQLIIAQSVRRNEHSPLSRIKSSNYGDNILALQEAKDRGAHDAIMLNTAGHVACATTSNIFALIHGTLYTPPLADGVMPGITRQKLLHNAQEKTMTPEDLMTADALYLTNSILGVRAVETLNGIKLKSIKPMAA